MKKEPSTTKREWKHRLKTWTSLKEINITIHKIYDRKSDMYFNYFLNYLSLMPILLIK